LREEVGEQEEKTQAMRKRPSERDGSRKVSTRREIRKREEWVECMEKVKERGEEQGKWERNSERESEEEREWTREGWRKGETALRAKCRMSACVKSVWGKE